MKVASALISDEQHQGVLVDDGHVEDVYEFRYLGSMSSAKCQDTEAARSTINISSFAVSCLRPCVWLRCEISLSTKGMAYEAVACLILLEGS